MSRGGLSAGNGRVAKGCRRPPHGPRPPTKSAHPACLVVPVPDRAIARDRRLGGRLLRIRLPSDLAWSAAGRRCSFEPRTFGLFDGRELLPHEARTERLPPAIAGAVPVSALDGFRGRALHRRTQGAVSRSCLGRISKPRAPRSSVARLELHPNRPDIGVKAFLGGLDLSEAVKLDCDPRAEIYDGVEVLCRGYIANPAALMQEAQRRGETLVSGSDAELFAKAYGWWRDDLQSR